MANRNDDGGEAAGADTLLRMTTTVVAAFARNNPLNADDLPDLIRSVHATLSGLSGITPNRHAERPKPAAPITKSVQHDYIICLEDGKRLKMLRRYLRTTYGLSPDEYRRRWSLPADYPMVAPAYAARRSEFAKKIGLGRGVRRRDGKDE